MADRFSPQAALRGEPSYIWRSGQDRRLHKIREWVDLHGRILDNGCGLGTYLDAFAAYSNQRFGLEVEAGRAVQALPAATGIAQAVGEQLPFASDTFDLIFSNEVIEHVRDDARYAAEMVRVAKPGGQILLFCPNRWYPVEQHGIFWRGQYKFGNICPIPCAIASLPMYVPIPEDRCSRSFTLCRYVSSTTNASSEVTTTFNTVGPEPAV
jgi:SAM-dependent methyltransferase